MTRYAIILAWVKHIRWGHEAGEIGTGYTLYFLAMTCITLDIYTEEYSVGRHNRAVCSIQDLFVGSPRGT